MSVEVLIPALRQEPVERLVWSLSLQSHPPDLVTIVSNEVQPFPVDVPTRLLRFWSEAYGVGDLDVALRQNVGIWGAEHDVILIQGDDQIAPPSMVEDSLTVLGSEEYIWGNHRLIDFSSHSAEEIRTASPDMGRSREKPTPPARHGFQSCYGGMFVARTDFLREFGGFDMAYNGRHGGEDQQLGYRLLRRRRHFKVLINEPPFSWHGIELRDGDTRTRHPWLVPVTNGCGAHDFVEARWGEVGYLQCRRCPVWHVVDESTLLCEEVIVRYRPELVTIDSIRL